MLKIDRSSKDLISCLLCYDAPCMKACKKNIACDKILRSLKFANYEGALAKINDSCLNCDAPCMDACLVDPAVNIKKIFNRCYESKFIYNVNTKKADISTDFCGIKLENPFLLSSSVVSSSYEMCKRAFEAGWAGAAFKTISFVDIHEASPRYSALKGLDGSFVAFKNIEQLSDHLPKENFLIFKKLKQEFPNKFLLVSIMGRDDDEWRNLAKEAEKSGADALELNFSCPNMTEENTGSDVGQVPELVERYTRVVKEAVKIPVIAKLTPNVISITPQALAAKRGGADGIAAINTIKSITDLNVLHAIDNDIADNKIAVGGLSGQAVKPIALRYIAEIAQNEELKGMHISAMGGIYNWEDAMMFIALGAGSIQITTAIMEYGYRIIDDLIEGLQLFLGKRGYNSLDELKGIILNRVVDINEIKRDYIIYPKFIKDKCIGCGRCFISCADGGHQAIKFENRKPTLNPKNCVGCHLCVLVCPNNAIISSEKEIKKSN